MNKYKKLALNTGIFAISDAGVDEDISTVEEEEVDESD